MAGAQYDCDRELPVRFNWMTLKGSPRLKYSVAIELSYEGGAELRLSPPPQMVKGVYFLGHLLCRPVQEVGGRGNGVRDG